ncbi:MAG: hypothetical protein HXX14_10020 [Bacteroidetes bacterium]|nr:hypothetical protein [Bacteroidota bacterium]
MKKKHVLLILGLLLAAFTSNAQKPRYIKTDTYEGVAFPIYWATNPKEVKYAFSPTDKEIATLEKKIADSISVLLSAYEKRMKAEENDDSVRHCDIVENLQKFKRQYCGFWSKGDKVIAVEFFLRVPENWRKVMIVPGLSRRCEAFSLNYSIKSGKFLAFFTDLSRL